MRRPEDQLFAGLDLHSNNVMVAIINQEGRRVEHCKLDCDLGAIVRYLDPLKSQLQSLAVESTFNWYWLVDGLRAIGYPIDLANPAKIEPYRGLKHADDKDDAYHLAELQRLKILPKAHVYDPVLRPVRDLLRRRTGLVHQRTALLLSFKSLYTRTHRATAESERRQENGASGSSETIHASCQSTHRPRADQTNRIVE